MGKISTSFTLTVQRSSILAKQGIQIPTFKGESVDKLAQVKVREFKHPQLKLGACSHHIWENTVLQDATMEYNMSESRQTYLPFITQRVGLSFLSHSLLIEVSKLQVIIYLKTFLRASGWVGHIDLQMTTIPYNDRYE